MPGGCTTEHVWQITHREQTDQLTVLLNGVRLPRPMQIEYPRVPIDIVKMWQSIDELLVAEHAGRVCGFLDVKAEPGHDLVAVKNLIVAEEMRRRGIGTALIGGANQWAHDHGHRLLMVEAQSQNWPAISFYRKLGFTFSGYNDRYYTNQIALFFTRAVV